MSRNSDAYTGWIKSRELVALAKPLSILLTLLFSLTVHINATLAAGGENILCASAFQTKIGDGQKIPAEQLQIEHCGICVVTNQFKSFGLSDGAALFENESDKFVHHAQLVIAIFVNISQFTNIRGPPAPEFNKTT